MQGETGSMQGRNGQHAGGNGRYRREVEGVAAVAIKRRILAAALAEA